MRSALVLAMLIAGCTHAIEVDQPADVTPAELASLQECITFLSKDFRADNVVVFTSIQRDKDQLEVGMNFDLNEPALQHLIDRGAKAGGDCVFRGTKMILAYRAKDLSQKPKVVLQIGLAPDWVFR